MPYIVTTTMLYPPRRAFATLDEARRHAGGIVEARSTRLASTATQKQIAALSESGGSVGPLPDGTIIEIEEFARYGVNTLERKLIADGWHLPAAIRGDEAAIIAAFNE